MIVTARMGMKRAVIGLGRALQVSAGERYTTARCPECVGKQEIRRSSESCTRPARGRG
jgi:hypothetical protein